MMMSSPAAVLWSGRRRRHSEKKALEVHVGVYLSFAVGLTGQEKLRFHSSFLFFLIWSFSLSAYGRRSLHWVGLFDCSSGQSGGSNSMNLGRSEVRMGQTCWGPQKGNSKSNQQPLAAGKTCRIKSLKLEPLHKLHDIFN